jgi:hypothetical protein
MSSDSHPTKKIKTAQAGTPIFSDLDLARLAIDATPQGAEIKHATVKHGGERLVFQLSDAATSLSAPFGIDDGSKFGGKPSLNIEMPEAQLAFFQGGIEATVKEAAVKNKEAWFGAIKPLPADEAVRASFNSRVREDEAGKHTPTLKVNVGLGSDAAKAIRVLTARRLPSGKVTKPAPGAPADVTRGCRVVPVLRTADGVWISVNAKKKTFEYGLVFEASDLLVVEEGAAPSTFNVEVASSDEEVDGGDGASVGDGRFDQ